MENNKRNWLLWVLLIFLPPFGILYMWITQKEFPKQKKINLSVIFAVWFLICMVVGQTNTPADNNQTNTVAENTQDTSQNNSDIENSTPTTEPTTEPTIKPTNTPKPTKKPRKVRIREEIEGVIGKDNLDTFNYIPGNNFTLIKFKGKENLTNDLIIKGMHQNIFNILKAIQPIINTKVDFNVVYPMQDKYGNVEDEIVIKATFLKKTNETPRSRATGYQPETRSARH